MSVAGNIPSPQPSHPSLPSSGGPSRYSNPVQTQRSAASSCEESPPWGAWLYERANPGSATHRHGSCASDRLASECGNHVAPGGRGWPLATPPKSCEGRNVLPSPNARFLGGKGPEVRRKGPVAHPTLDDPWATKKGSVLLSGPRQPEVGKSPVTAHCALCCRGYLVVLPLYGFAGFCGAN
jgi:hypothetical protein